MLGRYSPNFFGFGGCGCCTSGGVQYYVTPKKRIVVACHKRVTLNSITRNVTAFDYSGAELWQYDMGLTTGYGDIYIGGKPAIDSAGNVYIPYDGAKSVSTSDQGCIKLDKNGVLQWNYNVGVGTNQSAGQFDGAVGGSCFDSLGNVIFGISRFGANNTFAVKLTPAGVLVKNYDTLGAGFPGGTWSGRNSVDSIVVDSSDNVYLVPADNTYSFLFKLNGSTGAYVSQATIGLAPGTTTCGCRVRGMQADKSLGKIFMSCACLPSSPGGLYSSDGIIFRKWDMPSMTNDWDYTLNNMATFGSMNLSTSLLQGGGRDIGYTPSGIMETGVGRILDRATPAGTIAHLLRSGTLGSANDAGEQSVQPGFLCKACKIDADNGAAFGLMTTTSGGAGILQRLDSPWDRLVNPPAIDGHALGCVTYT